MAFNLTFDGLVKDVHSNLKYDCVEFGYDGNFSNLSCFRGNE